MGIRVGLIIVLVFLVVRWLIPGKGLGRRPEWNLWLGMFSTSELGFETECGFDAGSNRSSSFLQIREFREIPKVL